MNPSKLRLLPHPAQQLHKSAGEKDGLAVWEAKGSDPFFFLSADAGHSVDLQAGWYILDIPLAEQSGSLISPKLYLDYGVGFSELHSLGLGHLSTPLGIKGVVRFDHPVSRLRFDPSTKDCRFALGDISIKRVSKFGAALHMCGTLAQREQKRPTELALQVFHEYRQGGLRKAGDWIYARFMPPVPSKAVCSNYGDWVKQHDTVTAEDWKQMRAASKSLPSTPLISIVMPVYNTPEKWLHRCIQSVQRQAYPYWELCIADDASSNGYIQKVLAQYSARDPRIKVVYRDSNGHISAASNSALALATGEWMALLDHDDELPAHALYLVAKAINERPDTGVMYSDEDKIDAQGQRFDPYFKPDWNPDLFYSQNMVSHFGVYRMSLVKEVGGFRVGYEGSQDYDLALRCIERLKPRQIVHIPKVLYHWRAIEGSTALQKSEKSYAVVAGEHALADHFSRTKASNVTVHAVSHGYRVKRAFNANQPPKVSLIIPTRDRVELLRMCVSSILQKTDYPNYEIVVVDNQSVEPSTLAYFKQLRANPKVKIVPYDAPFNYSAINNAAVSASDGEIVGLINNDIEVISADWLSEMVSQAIRPEVGVVGAMLYYPNDTIQHAGVILGLGGVANHAYVGMPRGYAGQMSRGALIQNFSAVTAACLLVRRETYEAVNGLDPLLQVAFNDVDFCLRVRQLGLLNVWTPYAELYHHESASRGLEDTPEKQARFMREVALMTERWGEQLLNDPAYNPNLATNGTNFALAAEPRIAQLVDIISGDASLLHG